MNETEIVSATEVRPARPSARRYYVWQVAMWITILHTILVGAAFVLFAKYVVEDWRFLCPWQGSLGPMPSFSVQLAYWVVSPPGICVLGLLSGPLAVIACYRASLGKRSMPWLLSYWLSGGLGCLGALAAGARLEAAGPITIVTGPFQKTMIMLPQATLAAFVMWAVAMFPLGVTLLAALLTIERKKRPPSLEAGA